MDGIIMFYTYDPKDRKNLPTIAWQAILFVCVFWSAVEAPLSFVLGGGFSFEQAPWQQSLWADNLISLLFITDMVLRLGNKLNLPENAKWSLGQERPESKPYRKTFWFPVDLAASLPLELVASFLSPGSAAAVRLFKLARLARLRDLIHINEFLPRPFKAMFLFAGIALGLHFISCGWMLLNPRADLDPVSYYNLSLYWTVTTLTTVGYGDITPQTNTARIYTMGVMLIGVASYGMIIGNFSRMIMLADKSKEEKKEKMTGLQQFLRYYNIPSGLQRQVFSFYNHLLNQNATEEDTRIINELPQALQNELAIYMKIKLIRNVHIFKDCSTPCLKMIAQRLEQNFLSPNEYAIKKGEKGSEMFIIGHGEVEVSKGEKVVAQLKAGQFFGEIALLEDTIRNADVKAKAYCDLYTFNKEDFLKVIDKYPDLGEKFQQIYRKRTSDRSDQLKAA